MKLFTYGDLLSILQKATPEQLRQTATTYVSDLDEFMPVQGVSLTMEGDVLDENHLVLHDSESMANSRPVQ